MQTLSIHLIAEQITGLMINYLISSDVSSHRASMVVSCKTPRWCDR